MNSVYGPGDRACSLRSKNKLVRISSKIQKFAEIAGICKNGCKQLQTGQNVMKLNVDTLRLSIQDISQPTAEYWRPTPTLLKNGKITNEIWLKIRLSYYFYLMSSSMARAPESRNTIHVEIYQVQGFLGQKTNQKVDFSCLHFKSLLAPNIRLNVAIDKSNCNSICMPFTKRSLKHLSLVISHFLNSSVASVQGLEIGESQYENTKKRHATKPTRS